MTETLTQLLGDYLRVRRALGFKLEGTETLLTQFLTYLREHDADTITIEHALGFATAPVGASPGGTRYGSRPSAASPGGPQPATPACRFPRPGCCQPGRPARPPTFTATLKSRPY